MSNLPPGCTESTFGAPWNDQEYTREVNVILQKQITVSFSGPSLVDESVIESAIIEKVNEDLSKIDYIIEDIIIDKYK